MVRFGVRLAVVMPLVACCASCVLFTDAATRLAHDLEREARHLQSSREASRTFDHRPTSWPAGCSGGFTVTVARSVLGVYCDDGTPVPPDARGRLFSFSTTYHLRFVDVPHALVVDAWENATIRITLRKQGGNVIVAALEAVR